MESYLIDLGRMAYRYTHSFQKECVSWRLREAERTDIFLITEHPPVFTLGRRGKRDSIILPEQFIRQHGVDIVQTERGGDITYHGPGQLVVYPIIHLRQAKLSVKQYVNLLEEVMISCAADLGVTTGRDERNRGVWVGNNKIGSVGICIRKGVTFHGLAFNVCLDLEHFGWIQPCGLTGVGVTSINRETGSNINLEKAKNSIIQHLENRFQRQFQTVPASIITGKAA